MILGTEKRLEKLRAGEDDQWYEQTKDGWRGGVRHKNMEVIAFSESSRGKLIERYEWVLEGLPAGEFDQMIKDHLDSRNKP